MSKFKELEEAIKSNKSKYLEYKEKCFEFIKKLIQGMEEYCEVPKGYIRYVPLDDSLKEKRIYNLYHVMKLENDTFWHFKFEMFVVQLTQLVFHFRVKKENDYFIVKPFNDVSGNKIHPDHKEDFIEFYDFFFNDLISYYKDEFENWLQHKELKYDTIGFLDLR